MDLFRPAVRAPLYAAIAAAALAAPSSAREYDCDRPVEEFHASGAIQCGHLVWDLHPEHAARIADPKAFFQKYEALYRFLERFTGVSPAVPLTIAERCGLEKKEPEACPKGASSSDFEADFHERTVYLNAASAGEDLAFTAENETRPLVLSIAREMGGFFLPESKGVGYLWDPAMQEAWAEILAVHSFGMLVEQQRLGEAWYSRSHCERETGRAPCDSFIKGFDGLVVEASQALEAYEGRKEDLDDLVLMPPSERRAGERGPAFAGMLARLYRDERTAGRSAAFLDGLGELVRHYNSEFPAPVSWRKAEPTRELLRRKADVFVFLLSASIEKDVTGAFAGWRWPLSRLARVSVNALSRARWDARTKAKLLAALLSEKPSLAVPAGWTGAKGPPPPDGAADARRPGGERQRAAPPPAAKGRTPDAASAPPPPRGGAQEKGKPSAAPPPPAPNAVVVPPQTRPEPGVSGHDRTTDSLRRDPRRKRAVAKLIEDIHGNGASEEALSETKRITGEMLATANQQVLDNLVENRARIQIVPKDKQITDLPDFAALKGQKTFDGRPWEEVRGVATGSVCAIPEENVVDGDYGGYRRDFVLIHEYGHVVHHAGLQHEALEESFLDRLAGFFGIRRTLAPRASEVDEIYDESMERQEKTGLGDYADANSSEMFAQATAAYFDVGYRGENPQDLKRLNASLYDLMQKVYGPSRSLGS